MEDDSKPVTQTPDPVIDSDALANATSVAEIIAATKIPPTTNLIRSFIDSVPEEVGRDESGE
jgi:hypothetical protein